MYQVVNFADNKVLGVFDSYSEAADFAEMREGVYIELLDEE